jgi:hypothetical protein
MNDQRGRPRAQLNVYLNKYIGGVPYTAFAQDISPTGLSLTHLLEPSQAGARVGLQFQLPGCEEVIYAEGNVVRQWASKDRPSSGVHFTLLTERHREMIASYVEARATR